MNLPDFSCTFNLKVKLDNDTEIDCGSNTMIVHASGLNPGMENDTERGLSLNWSFLRDETSINLKELILTFERVGTPTTTSFHFDGGISSGWDYFTFGYINSNNLPTTTSITPSSTISMNSGNTETIEFRMSNDIGGT